MPQVHFIFILIQKKCFVTQVLLRGEHVVMVSPEQQADNDQVCDVENDE